MNILKALFSTKARESAQFKLLDPEEYREAIKNSGTKLFDLRTANEYRTGHIENAVNVDFFDQSKFQQFFGRLKRSEPIYIYCRSGNRSGKAASLLLKMGFEKIYDLSGGYLAWR